MVFKLMFFSDSFRGKRDGKSLPMRDDTFDSGNSIGDQLRSTGPTAGDAENPEGHHGSSWDEAEEEDHVEEVESDDLETEDKFHCRSRYQHTRIDVSGLNYDLIVQVISDQLSVFVEPCDNQ